MKKIAVVLLVLTGFTLGFSSCQQVFTYSVFGELGLQRDVANLSPEQQKSYAQGALASGDTDAMNDAYTALADTVAATTAADDPELYTLAAELAIGASGLVDTLTGALSVVTEGGGTDDLTAIFDSILDSDETIALLDDASGYVEDLVNAGEDVSTDLYVNAAAALLIVAVDDAGGIENLDYENPPEELETAMTWAELGGVDFESLLGG